MSKQISYFEPDETDYDRSEQVKDDDGNWTTQGEIDDLADEWAEIDDDLDLPWDYEPPDIDLSAGYEKNLEREW